MHPASPLTPTAAMYKPRDIAQIIPSTGISNGSFQSFSDGSVIKSQQSLGTEINTLSRSIFYPTQMSGPTRSRVNFGSPFP